MSRLPSATSGFFQAPDTTTRVITPQVQGTNTIYQAARAGARPGQQVLKILDSVLGATNAGINMRIKYNAAEEGAGAEAALQDQAGMRAAIESDDPSWDFSIWNQEPDGTTSVMDSDQIRGKILERMPVPENASEAWKKGYINRLMPSVERDIFNRGFARRDMFVEGQLGLISEGLISRSASYDRAARESGITPGEHFDDYMGEAYADIQKLVPQVTGESDELYENRLKQTAWEKVFKPVVPALIRSGDYSLLGELDAVASGSIRPQFLDMVRRGHVENIHEALKNPKITEEGGILYQMPIRGMTDELLPDTPESQDPGQGTENFVISSEQDMRRYLNQSQFTDPDSMFYISDPDRIMNQYFGVAKSDDELNNTMRAMNGESTRPYDAKYEESFERLGYIKNGFIAKGPDAGLAIARTGNIPTTISQNLAMQAQHNDPEVSAPAIEAIVLMSQYPDQRSYNQMLRNHGKDTPTQMMLHEIRAYQSQINLFPGGADGPMNPQPDAVREIATRYNTSARSQFQPDDQASPASMQSAGYVLDSAMFLNEYTEKGILDEVNALANEHVGADFSGMAPNIQQALASKYAEFSHLVVNRNPGVGQEDLRKRTDGHFKAWLDSSVSTAEVNGISSIGWLPDTFSENGKWSESFTDKRMSALFKKNGLDWSIVARVEPMVHPKDGSGYIAFDSSGQTIYNQNRLPAFITTQRMYEADVAAQNKKQEEAAANRKASKAPFDPKPFHRLIPN